MIWFFQDPARYQAEVEAITALEAASSWLTVQKWDFGDGARLICEAEIQVGDRTYPVTLRYNTGFPFVPPSVIPRVKERWSDHQYGLGGELCLEYGPDNWVPDYRGADMLTSAHRLIEGEALNEDPTIQPMPVPSRHRSTHGQALRGQTFRFLKTKGLQEKLAQLDPITQARFCVRFRQEGWVAYLTAVTLDGNEWADPEVPESDMYRTEVMCGLIVQRPEGLGTIPMENPTLFRHAVLGEPEEGFDPSKDEFLLFLTDAGLRPFYLWRSGNMVFEFPATIEPDLTERLDADYATLAHKRVGLIGCGSVGSKVATMLARSGVGHALLVDDDFLGPENLVRNELDWSAVGEHKASALARRLRLVRPAISVDVRRHRLGGQESAAGLEAVLSALAACDVIIDATAAGEAFNLAATAATQGERAMLWAEVFAGGIGGTIVRSRPGLEPTPHEARRRILQWYEQQGINVPVEAADRYGAIIDGKPQIADDADVSVIAAHLARLTIDTLLARVPSRFPYSAYAIGLHEGWVFTQPFDTLPIDLGLADAVASPDPNDPKWKAGVDGLSKLIEDRRAASTDID